MAGWSRLGQIRPVKGVLRNLKKNEPEPGEAFRTEGSHLSSQPGGKSAPLVSRGLPLPPQPPSPTFPDTGPGHLPDAIPRGARPPGAKLAEPSRGAIPSLLLLLPAAPRARGRRLRHACLQALQPNQAARPGRPSPTRPPGARRGSLPAPSSPGDRGPGSAPPPPLASSSRPGRRRCPASRRSRTRGAAGGAGGERSAELHGGDGGEGRAAGEGAGSRGGRRIPGAPRARSLSPETRGPSPSALAGHLVQEVSPDRPGRAGSGGVGYSGAGAAGGRPPRGRESWLRLGARRPAAGWRRGESGRSRRRDRGGAGSPGAWENRSKRRR